MNLDVIVGVGGTIAALAVSQWPRISPLLKPASPRPVAPPTGRPISYQQSLEALAVVRARIAGAGGVCDEAQAAIETLTHVLVAGSDK